MKWSGKAAAILLAAVRLFGEQPCTAPAALERQIKAGGPRGAYAALGSYTELKHDTLLYSRFGRLSKRSRSRLKPITIWLWR